CAVRSRACDARRTPSYGCASRRDLEPLATISSRVPGWGVALRLLLQLRGGLGDAIFQVGPVEVGRLVTDQSLREFAVGAEEGHRGREAHAHRLGDAGRSLAVLEGL